MLFYYVENLLLVEKCYTAGIQVVECTGNHNVTVSLKLGNNRAILTHLLYGITNVGVYYVRYELIVCRRSLSFVSLDRKSVV